MIEEAKVERFTSAEAPSDIDIPPAIACATCGLSTCDGCARDSEPPATHLPSLPWENDGASGAARLIDTCELTALHPERAFGELRTGSAGAALRFAIVCEVWAVGSFSLAWALAFFAFFPHLAARMASSPQVLLLAGSILATLIVFVVFVHALWGLGLEWGIARAGRPASVNLGLRFGLYACGWDFLTSPAGFVAELPRVGLLGSLGRVRAGARAPRPSLSAYLEICRKLTREEQRHAIWTAIALGVVSVLASGSLLFATLLALWVPGIF